jgi:integrase
MAKTRSLGFVFQPTYTERLSDGTKVTKTAATWCISYSVNGKRRRESTGFINKADAVRRLKLRIGEAGLGRKPEFNRIKFRDLAERLRNNYIANGKKSLRRIEQSLKHLRAYFGDDYRAERIDDAAVSAYIAARMREPHRQGSGASNGTINRELTALKTALNLAKFRPDFKLLEENNARKGFFEPHEFGAILHELPHYLVPFAHAAYLTGWRSSELLSRQWQHVDFDAGWIRLEPGETKTNDGRNFPMLPESELRVILDRQLESARAIEKRTGVPVDFVFHYDTGRPIGQYRGAWISSCKRAGLAGKYVHDFRRTAVRNLIRSGVSQIVAMQITGHRTAEVFSRYAIIDETMMQEAAIKLAAHHAQEDRTYPMTPGEIERLAARSRVQVESKG